MIVDPSLITNNYNRFIIPKDIQTTGRYPFYLILEVYNDDYIDQRQFFYTPEYKLNVGCPMMPLDEI